MFLLFQVILKLKDKLLLLQYNKTKQLYFLWQKYSKNVILSKDCSLEQIQIKTTREIIKILRDVIRHFLLLSHIMCNNRKLRYLNEQWKLPFHVTDRELKIMVSCYSFVQGSWGKQKRLLLACVASSIYRRFFVPIILLLQYK